MLGSDPGDPKPHRADAKVDRRNLETKSVAADLERDLRPPNTTATTESDSGSAKDIGTSASANATPPPLRSLFEEDFEEIFTAIPEWDQVESSSLSPEPFDQSEEKPVSPAPHAANSANPLRPKREESSRDSDEIPDEPIAPSSDEPQSSAEPSLSLLRTTRWPILIALLLAVPLTVLVLAMVIDGGGASAKRDQKSAAELELGTDPIAEHVKQLERIAQEQKEERHRQNRSEATPIVSETNPLEDDDQSETPIARPSQRPAPFHAQPGDPFKPRIDNPLANTAASAGRNTPFVSSKGQAFTLISGDPDGNLSQQTKLSPTVSKNEDQPATETDARQKGNQDVESRSLEMIELKWLNGVDVVASPDVLEPYHVSELLGRSTTQAKAITDWQPIVGLDFVERNDRFWIGPLAESESVAAESMVAQGSNVLAGAKCAFDTEGRIVGMQAVFAPLDGDVLSIDQRNDSRWMGQRTADVKTCLSNRLPIYGCLLYRDADNIVGIRLLAR